MGTPEFAVPSLRKLVASHHQVVGVVTPPDRPQGRGQIVSMAHVKKEAWKHQIAVIQPNDLSDVQFLKTLSDFQADCFAVVGFRILPEAVFKIPHKGAVNLHASLLPKYRGAAPIQWAIINGEKETGVTTFFIRKRVDTGDLILQQKVSILENETAGELHDRLALIGADLMLRTLDSIESCRAARTPQCGGATLAPKILPEHCEIQWNKSAAEIHNLIRGLSPRPGAFTMLNGRRLKIYRSKIAVDITDRRAIPGTVIHCSRNGMTVQTEHGVLAVMDVQLEGKERMGIVEFLCGRTVVEGIRLGESAEVSMVKAPIQKNRE